MIPYPVEVLTLFRLLYEIAKIGSTTARIIAYLISYLQFNIIMVHFIYNFIMRASVGLPCHIGFWIIVHRIKRLLSGLFAHNYSFLTESEGEGDSK